MAKFYGVPNASGKMSLQSYTESDERYDRIPLSAEELSPEPFTACIKAVNWYRGRSSAGYEVEVENPDGTMLSAVMSLDRFLKLLNTAEVMMVGDDLYFDTYVKFVKKGQAVFVEVVE